MFGAWSFAAPFDGPADEVQHSIRAAGVASFDLGQIFAKPIVVPDAFGRPGIGAAQRVPVGMDAHATCFGNNPQVSADCAKGLHGGPMGEVTTAAGRYNPIYYMVVGPPLRLWTNWGGLVVARLINSALTAALLAWAMVCLLRWSRFGLMAAGLLGAATPMLAHLAGAVNPNAAEIAAGIVLFSAGIPLLLSPPSDQKRMLIHAVGVSSVILLTLRAAGPGWLFFGLLALLVPMRRQWLREWWRMRVVKLWIGGIALAAVLSLAWIIGMGTVALVKPAPGTWNYTPSNATVMYLNSWYTYLRGMVGVAGWFDTNMWAPFYIIWIVLVASLVVFACMVGNWALRWRFVAFFLGVVVFPGYMQVSQVNMTGFITNGRYMLPLAVGMPLLAAYVLERQLLTQHHVRSLNRMFVVLLVPIQMVFLVFAMVRWQRGIGNGPGVGWLNPLKGNWHPPTGSVPPLLLMLAGVLLTGWLFWRAQGLALAYPNRPAELDVPTTKAETPKQPDGEPPASELVATIDAEPAAAEPQPEPAPSRR
jgi:hypothetical protein